ncbi:MAG: F0F1 ATP synthase subunit B [Planctomycetota bacterium]|nr:F0F1 ATP synthase subunit B [Planctomycetota bacterium]
MPPFLTPELQVLIWSVAIFLVLLALLWKFAWGPIMLALEQREKMIQDRIGGAEAKFKEAEAKVADYEKKIHAAKDDAAEIIAEGKRDVERLKTDLLAEADKDAARTLERAKREIALAKDAAVAEIRDEVVALSAEMAAKVLEREVKPEDHRHFIEDAIREAGKN